MLGKIALANSFFALLVYEVLKKKKGGKINMKAILHRSLPVLVVILLLSACRVAPVYNVPAAHYPVQRVSAADMAKVKSAITKAGQELGWIMKPINPGHIRGSLFLRTHKAVVDIRYNAKDYNIKYKDSENLHYTGKSIHKNYNSWVANLNNKIQQKLVAQFGNKG